MRLFWTIVYNLTRNASALRLTLSRVVNKRRLRINDPWERCECRDLFDHTNAVEFHSSMTTTIEIQCVIRFYQVFLSRSINSLVMKQSHMLFILRSDSFWFDVRRSLSCKFST
jgi:hypothetical protein